MARIKWEDRKYNSYFTMEGIGRRVKTRTDKDLKRRLAALGFRSYWRKLELYRKSLLSRLGESICSGDNLDARGGRTMGEVSNLDRGHLAIGIEKPSHKAWQSAEGSVIASKAKQSPRQRGDCFGLRPRNDIITRQPRNDIQQDYRPATKPREDRLPLTDHCLPAFPGPGNWIQTRPRPAPFSNIVNVIDQ